MQSKVFSQHLSDKSVCVAQIAVSFPQALSRSYWIHEGYFCSGGVHNWMDSSVIIVVQLQGELWALGLAAAEPSLLSALHTGALPADPV